MTQGMRLARCGLVAAAVLAAGCDKKGADDDAGHAPVSVDTANKDQLDGMSDRELEQQARPMTPEEAAAAGVQTDTTIHIENLGSSDSTPAGAANNDTVAGRPPAAAPSAPATGGAPARP